MSSGHMRRRGPNRWQLIYEAPRGPDGKRKQNSQTIQGNKKQAQARMSEILHSLNEDRYIKPTHLTVSAYIDTWLQDYAEVSVRPRTLRGYRSIVKNHIKPAFGSIRLRDLSARRVQSYYANCIRSGLSAQTILHVHRLFSAALKQAVKWDLMRRNILEDITPPKRQRPNIRFLSPDEVHTLLDESQLTNFYIPIHLAVSTGLRRSEILGLRWSDIKLRSRTITVSRTMVEIAGNSAHIDRPKSHSSNRTIPIGTETVKTLNVHLELRSLQLAEMEIKLTKDSQVCIRPDGTLLRPDHLTKSYRKIATRCGLSDVRFHDLRHTHATLLLSAGIPIHVVQKHLGHASIQTTVDIYGHVMPESEIAVAKKIDTLVDRMLTEPKFRVTENPEKRAIS